MLWQLVLAAVVIWLTYRRWKNRKYHELYQKYRTDRTELPFLGQAYLYLGTGEDRMTLMQNMGREAYQKHGIVALWFANVLYFMASDPVICEFFLKTCLEKENLMKYLRYASGNGTVFAPVAIWRPRRKIIAPTFSPKNLNNFVSIFSKQSRIMVEQLRPAARAQPFSVWNYVTTYTMDSVCETALGVQMHAQKDPEQPFLKSFNCFCELSSARICQPWLQVDAIYKLLPSYKRVIEARDFLWNFVDKIVYKKRKAMETEQKAKEAEVKNKDTEDQGELKTFLELLMSISGGKSFSDVELREETLVMALAGTDTSAVGIAFTLVMLSKHQGVQLRVFEELSDVFNNTDRPVEPEDLPRLKYLEAVIKETMRLYPPVPVIVRKTEEDVVMPSGTMMLKGCGILISIWALHRNPHYWGADAEVFRPDRFLDPNTIKHPVQYIPFSYGPRNCLGYQYAMMSMKTALSTILRNYRVLPATPDDANCKATAQDLHKPLRVKFDIMMKDVDGFTIALQSR